MPTAKMPTTTKVNLQPINDRVVIERDAAPERTMGGIVLPDNARERQAKGTVIAVGPGRILADGTRATMHVKVGDRVWFSPYTSATIEVEGEEYELITEQELFAIER